MLFKIMKMTAKYSPTKYSTGVYSSILEDVNNLSDQFSRLSLSDRRKITPTPVVKANGFFHGSSKMSLSMNASGDKHSQSTRNKPDFKDVILSPIPKIKYINQNQKETKDSRDNAVKFHTEEHDGEIKEPLLNESKEDVRIKYYAVALPDEIQPPSDTSSLVYEEIKLALAAIKSYKGGRVKEFPSKDDALEFASKPLDKIVVEPTVSEDDSNLKSATCQELCQLRKYIEAGKENSFIQRVWSNPKILVGKSDTPSVMHEGIRFNALHVAAKCNKPFICQLILDTVENPKFMKQIYPSESESSCRTRMLHLLDMYINTPDKKTGDTPLHYASKFGCIDCVKVILSHPLCVFDRRNIDGLTAEEIICSRARPQSDALMEDMNEIFKGMFYVSIFRSENNDVLPVIGKPSLLKDVNKLLCDVNQKSDSILSLKAFAGPMSPDIAELFYWLLKNPSSQIPTNKSELKLLSKIRFTDREKGLERIGRWLARDLKVDWREYFSFLDIFTDLCSEEGLSAFESYLKDRQRGLCFDLPFDAEDQSIFLVHEYPSHVNPLAHHANLCLKREKETDIEVEEIFSTPPSSPVKNEFLTPPSSPKSFRLKDKNRFLEGSMLTKQDVDALLAVGDLSTTEYPFVTKWKEQVEYEMLSSMENSSHKNTLMLLASLTVPSIHIDRNICTPKKTLLNTGFCSKRE